MNQGDDFLDVGGITYFKSHLERLYVSKCGLLRRHPLKHHSEKEQIRFYIDKYGYHRFWHQHSDGSRQFIPVHRIVALTFLKRDLFRNEVNHINGDRMDNSLMNLEWTSRTENERHSRAVLGKRCVGEKASRSKLVTEEIRMIRSLHSKSWGILNLAKCFSVSKSQVNRIVKRINWSHV